MIYLDLYAHMRRGHVYFFISSSLYPQDPRSHASLNKITTFVNKRVRQFVHSYYLNDASMPEFVAIVRSVLQKSALVVADYLNSRAFCQRVIHDHSLLASIDVRAVCYHVDSRSLIV